MKWLVANKEHVCSINPQHIIKPGDEYLGTSYTALCVECGKKKEAGLLVYDGKKRGYIDASVGGGICYMCDQPSIGVVMGKQVCKLHVGEPTIDPFISGEPLGDLTTKTEETPVE